MDDQGAHRDGRTGLELEDLPQLDGSCDACEPDEARAATQVCHTCSFAFCPAHADEHGSRTRHPLNSYNHETTSSESLETNGVSGSGAEADTGTAAGGMELAVGIRGLDLDGEGRATPGVSARDGEDVAAARIGEEERTSGDHDDGGAEAGPEAAAAAPQHGRRDTVTVERLRCHLHGEEGSLYCKTDEKIICVLCAVQGEHSGHEIITLPEAYHWQKNREGYDLLYHTKQMGEKIMKKWTDPVMTPPELQAYVDGQFEMLTKLVRLEERRHLHLVDLKEACLTASAAEKIAEITVETERLQEEMSSISNQLGLLDQQAGTEGAPASLARVPAEGPGDRPGQGHRPPHVVEARLRLPEPRRNPFNPQDLDEDEPGPSMGHAP